MTGRFGNGLAGPAANLDEFHQENGIVDHDAGQLDRAHHARHGQIQPHQEMAPDDTDKGLDGGIHHQGIFHIFQRGQNSRL